MFRKQMWLLLEFLFIAPALGISINTSATVNAVIINNGTQISVWTAGSSPQIQTCTSACTIEMPVTVDVTTAVNNVCQADKNNLTASLLMCTSQITNSTLSKTMCDAEVITMLNRSWDVSLIVEVIKNTTNRVLDDGLIDIRQWMTQTLAPTARELEEAKDMLYTCNTELSTAKAFLNTTEVRERIQQARISELETENQVSIGFLMVVVIMSALGLKYNDLREALRKKT